MQEIIGISLNFLGFHGVLIIITVRYANWMLVNYSSFLFMISILMNANTILLIILIWKGLFDSSRHLQPQRPFIAPPRISVGEVI